MAGDRERALLAGFTDYLEKPLNPETFADRVLAYF
jgi:CheY-like chemotaxis protein